VTIVTIVIWTICAAVCAQIAGNKGHSRGQWACIGALIGVFGVLAATLLKPKVQEPPVVKQPPSW
jgi:hypothetical protein